MSAPPAVTPIPVIADATKECGTLGHLPLVSFRAPVGSIARRGRGKYEEVMRAKRWELVDNPESVVSLAL